MPSVSKTRPPEGTPGDAPPGAEADIPAYGELGTILECELAHVEEEVLRVRGIVADAIVTLSSSFDRLYHLQSVDATESGVNSDSDRDQAASDAIRALQFEDISTQALNEALGSVAYLRRLAAEIKTARDTDDLALRISTQHEAWEKLRRKAVLQENLDEGSVDLF